MRTPVALLRLLPRSTRFKKVPLPLLKIRESDRTFRESSRAADQDRADVAQRYQSVRALTERLAAPLSAEDQTVQSMADTSPTKWHRAHTTWFFETVVLSASDARYQPYRPAWGVLFNSYYEALGPRHPRPERGLLTRPSCAEVSAYRRAIDRRMLDFIESADAQMWSAAAPLVDLGLHHEQQHQELLLTDILHALSRNPLFPAYTDGAHVHAGEAAPPLGWTSFPGGLHDIGYAGAGFAFDNERPRHTVSLRPFALASRMVTNGEWIAFMADGGYARPEFWLADGWRDVAEKKWTSPLHWRNDAGAWRRFTLHGEVPLNPADPVVNVSFYEADAYARWSGARLPTEAEWEVAAHQVALRGNFLTDGDLEPKPAPAGGLAQMFGDGWEWTQSPYSPFPGFRPNAGAVSEYNGKFMINQMVLRGGSCLTPAGHMRPTYRNFFYPGTRWQFAGLRLARDL